MPQTSELIVEFRRGVSEESARGAIASAGGRIRRRMRTDHQDQVTLLVRLESSSFDSAKSGLHAHPDVTRIEENTGGYVPMD